MTENKKSRTAHLLSWLLGLFFLLGGVMSLGDSVIGGLFVIFGSLLILPFGSRLGLKPWQRGLLALLLIGIGIGLSSTGDGGAGPVTTEAPLGAGEASAALGKEFTGAALQILEGYDALTKRQYGVARRKSLDVKDTLQRIEALLSRNSNVFSEEELDDILKTIQVFQSESTLIYKTATLKEGSDKLMSEIEEAEDVGPLLPRLELLSRGHKENSEDWRQYGVFLDSIKGTTTLWPIEQKDVDTALQIAQIQMSFAEVLDENLETLKGAVPDYHPLEERVIPTPTAPVEERTVISSELEGFFESFDMDGDNKLSIGEAQEFYYWVENNVQYRYDSEEETRPIVGTLAGDGRPGPDFRQRPDETYSERAGDCEDMATLEQAFYRYYGIDAYVAGVNAEEPDVLDHATAIVWIADKTDLFRETLGDLVYYEIGEGASDIYGDPMRPGVYMLVDNAYSGAMGYLSGGITPGTFRVHCAIPLERGYEDWSDVVKRCGVPMD